MGARELDITAVPGLVSSQLGTDFFWPQETSGRSFSGGEYNVYMLVDKAQNRRVSVRIPKVAAGEITAFLLKREVELRQRIDKAQLERFQPLLAFDSTSNNCVGRPFLILGWADGGPMMWSETTPSCQTKRQGVLRAMANTNLDLLCVHQRGVSALDWIRGKIDRKIARATAGTFPHGTVSECEKQKSLISRYWIPEMDDLPHVLVHGDLSGNNIIVNDDFEVQSVIDLGWAEIVPLQFAAEYPRFLVGEPTETESGFSWAHNNNVQLRDDRRFYLTCIKERAEREGGLAWSYYLLLSRADEINRHWWYTAASRADIHRAMAKCDWDPMSVIEQGQTT